MLAEDEDVFAGNLGLNFYDSSELESESLGSEDENAIRFARNVLRVLLMGRSDESSKLYSWKAFKSVFYERDYELTRALRCAFQQGFEHVFTQLQQAVLSEKQQRQAQFFISNCMAFLPYADLNPYESIAIPQWMNGRWQLIDYKVTPIELTPRSGLKKLFIHEQDRVFAYGLEPLFEENAEPHLLFMGTTYPAGQGFMSTIMTDLEAFSNPGASLYYTGRDNIKAWLNRQRKKTHVCGTSLGGALSLLLAIDQGDQISRVDALNPPGLYQPILYSERVFDSWDELNEKPDVYVQRQAQDPISQFGVWKEDWHVLHVTPPKGVVSNSLFDHALNYAGLTGTRFYRQNTRAENEANWIRNIWLYGVLRGVAYGVLLAPYRYLLLPLYRVVQNNLLTSVFMSVAFALSGFSFTIGLSWMIIPVISASWLGAALAAGAIEALWNKDVNVLFAHLNSGGRASLLRLELGMLFTATLVLSCSVMFLPTLLPFAQGFMLVAITLPALFQLTQKLIHVTQVVLGMNQDDVVKCHQPELKRNRLLDLYDNTAQAAFTYKELHDYYEVKRCLLKSKPLIPLSSSKSSIVFSKEGVIKSKQEVLKDSIEDSNKENVVLCTASKAKLYDMRQTIALLNRVGFYKQDLKVEAEKQDAAYRQGKVQCLRD